MKYTKRDFNKFESLVAEWLLRFGLVDYEVRIQHGGTSDCYAQVEFEQTTRDASFKLSKEESPDNPFASVERVALHETLHVLLADLRLMAENRNYDVSRWDTEEHKIINVLIKCLLD